MRSSMSIASMSGFLPVHIHEIQTKTHEYLKALKINNTLSWTLNLRNLAPKFTKVIWDSRYWSSDSKPNSFQPFTSSWWYNTNHRCSTWTHSLGIDRRHGCLIDLRSLGLASWNFGRYPNSVKWPFFWGGVSKKNYTLTKNYYKSSTKIAIGVQLSIVTSLQLHYLL